MRKLYPVLATIVPLMCASAADDKWNVTAECQMVVLPQKLVLPLLPGLNDDAKIGGVVAKLQELITNGEATLAAHLVAKSNARVRTITETTEELRYATEHALPHLPANAPENIEVLKAWPFVGITPTAFETRNMGATFEIEPVVLGDGKALSVGVVMQHVRFLRWLKTDAGVLANGKHLFIEQPVFHTAKNTSSLTVGKASGP